MRKIDYRKEKCLWLKLRPLESVLRTLLEAIKTKDAQAVFGQPVNIKEVPDYLEIVSHPMDLSTMQVIIIILNLRVYLYIYIFKNIFCKSITWLKYNPYNYESYFSL